MLQQALRGNVAVVYQRDQLFGNFAVVPQPNAFMGAVGFLEAGFVLQMELPFVHAVEQGRSSFVRQVGQFCFVAQHGDFGGLRGQLFQRPHGLQPRMFRRQLVQGFFGQVVRFVNAVEAVFRRRQDDTAAHADIDHQQIVVTHHHVHGVQRVARKEERAFGAVRAGGFQAAVRVVGHFFPQ